MTEKLIVPTTEPSVAPQWAEHDWDVTLTRPEGLILTAANVTESNRSYRAEVTITMNGKALYWGDMDLMNDSSRSRLADKLTKKVPSIKWDDELGRFSYDVVARRRAAARPRQVGGVEWEGEAFLVTPLVPVSEPAVIYADGGSCKSFLALVAGFAVMNAGINLPGGLVAHNGGGVLYLDWESHEKRVRHRLYRVGKALGLPTHNIPFHYKNMAEMSLESARRELRSYIRRHNIKLVIVDSLAPASLSLGMTDGTASAVRLMTLLSSFGADLGASVLAIGHVAKGRRGSIFGSVFYRNLARSTWEITMALDGMSRHVTAKPNKVNDGPMQMALTITFEFERTGLICVKGEEHAGAASLSLAGVIKLVMETATEPVGKSWVLEKVKQHVPKPDPSNVAKRLKKAVEDGYLQMSTDEYEELYSPGPRFGEWEPGGTKGGRPGGR